MKRVGMTWRVYPEHWEAYRHIHLNPWPELLEAIQAVGIHNYSIFALGDRMFAYMEVEGDDVNAALARLAETDVYRRWAEVVGPWLMPEAVDGSGVRFLELESIFYCP